ncbi:MAG: transposase [bacterium]|nr:transposase [bacterium]
MSSITYVGLDVHKRTIAVAMLQTGAGEVLQWEVANEPTALKRLIRKLKPHAPLRCVYEAGPTGYGLQRQLQGTGIDCMIAAPSLIPVRHGDRVKTDHRDARKLAHLHAAGLLTAVHPRPRTRSRSGICAGAGRMRSWTWCAHGSASASSCCAGRWSSMTATSGRRGTIRGGTD